MEENALIQQPQEGRLSAALMRYAVGFAESRWCPDMLLRAGIREVCRRRLRSLPSEIEAASALTHAFIESSCRSPIAVETEAANEQHYEVPPEFFELVLGPALKYSSCYWSSATENLAAAEVEALRRTVANAELEDGHTILELGCGWGSLSLHMAKSLPNSRIVAVSNSADQRRFIQKRACDLGIANLEVRTADMNKFEPEERFDRVVSVEMFEHMRNHARLLERISSWLRPGGKLLVHIFCGAPPPYFFEDDNEDDWMARNFFSGGVMPSDDLLLRYQHHMAVEATWRWNGRHYARTAEAWLDNLDHHRQRAEEILRNAPDPALALRRWRIFFLACAELFGFDDGNRWWVSHYRFVKRG
jgi:cyclopropane-fatty-acyl-phospholipid synthase